MDLPWQERHVIQIVYKDVNLLKVGSVNDMPFHLKYVLSRVSLILISL